MKNCIITLSGSMKVYDIMLQLAEEMSSQKNVVLVPFKDPNENGLSDDQKKMHEELHERRIDMSDVLYVVNINGYIGKSTKNEIKYAFQERKHVEFHERPSLEVLKDILLSINTISMLHVFEDQFNILANLLITSIYTAYIDSMTDEYNFIESTKESHGYQTDLDLLFELTKTCFPENFDVDAFYDPMLKELYDNIDLGMDDINLDLLKELNVTIERSIHWTVRELLYSTSSELLARLNK